VVVYVDATYRNGAPAAANFSLSVYDESLLKTPEKYPLSITNYLSLTSELRGRIDNPGYYFKDTLQDTRRNRDLLMMVHGWRRFTWTDVLDEKRAAQSYLREEGLAIAGQILRSGGKKAPPESLLKIMTMQGNTIMIRPDSAGRFYSDDLLYYDSISLVLQTENGKGKKQPYKVMVDGFNPPAKSSYTVSAFSSFDGSRYLRQSAEQKNIQLAGSTRVLKEIEIEEKKEVDRRFVGTKADRVIYTKGLFMGHYAHIFELIQSRVPGAYLGGTFPNLNLLIRNIPASFLMNGMQSSAEVVSTISPNDVHAVEVMTNMGALYGINGAVVNVILKESAFDRVAIGVNQVKYPGFYQAREFYSPNYEVADDRHNLPDKRTTLFWEPMVETDATGKIAIGFYTADQSSRYRVVVEGITPDGYPGVGTMLFEVK
jgi:hypothetical protein